MIEIIKFTIVKIDRFWNVLFKYIFFLIVSFTLLIFDKDFLFNAKIFRIL